MDDGASLVLTDTRATIRARFETKRREMTVVSAERLTPHMIRVTLNGDLTGFQSLGFDDHVKLVFADPETGVLILPEPNMPPVPGAPKPVMRDYTPRRFDVKGGTMVIDIALHEAGPATAWALAAKPGDILNIGGPRGSQIVPVTFDSYLLIGDDTALPAIGRRLEELPAGAKVIVLAEVDTPEDRLTFETRADATIYWVYRHANLGPRRLNDALRGMWVPQHAVHVWVACEASQARLIRDQLIDDHGVNPKWLKAAAYWRHGDPGAHERLD